jgi:hypothetical protein
MGARGREGVDGWDIVMDEWDGSDGYGDGDGDSVSDGDGRGEDDGVVIRNDETTCYC